jgi:hypothetical protein
MKIHRETGFVLLTVLLMVSIMMIFTLTQWQGFMLLQRMMNQFIDQSNRLSGFEKTFDAIQQNLNYDLDKEQVGQVAWNGSMMKYKMIPKGYFPCIHQVIKGKPYSTQHVQIKLWLQEHPQQGLDIRVAKPVPLRPCLLQPRLVNSMILSWSYKA